MIQLQAPAKLNLFLRVLGPRPDGYHEVETLLERIDLADELTFEEARGTLSMTCDEPTLSVDEGNLVLRAARLLQQEARTTRGASIHLTKRIPIAAGLGGGSSDAAAALRGLNELWGLRLGPAELLPLAARLGSDVPFFLLEAAFAIGRARGDVCEPVQGEGLVQVLVVPEARLATKDVYEGFRQHGAPAPRGVGFNLTASHPSVTMMRHALRNGSLSELAKGMWNDLEPEAIRRCPVSALIQSQLREHRCLGVLVSGSGPAVFGLCHDLAHAQDVATGLRIQAGTRWRIDITRTVRPNASKALNAS